VAGFLRSRDRSLIEAKYWMFLCTHHADFSGRATGASLKLDKSSPLLNLLGHFSGRATGASLKPHNPVPPARAGFISPVARPEPH